MYRNWCKEFQICVPWPKQTIKRHVISQYCMKISHFLLKICHFGGHFEFSNFSGINRHRRSNILTDSCSTPNLAMETTCFIPDLQKKSSDMPNPINVYPLVLLYFHGTCTQYPWIEWHMWHLCYKTDFYLRKVEVPKVTLSILFWILNEHSVQVWERNRGAFFFFFF